MVLINSVPRAGTHLLMRVFDLAGYSRDTTVNVGSQGASRYVRRVFCRSNGELLTLAVPLADTTCGLVSRGKFRKRFAPLGKIPDGKYVSGHLLWSRFAAGYFRQLSVRMIVILRDPRAVAMSHIHWVRDERHEHPLRERYRAQSIAECMRDEFCGIGNTGIASYPSQLPMSTRYRNMALWKKGLDVHFTSFEALVGPRGGGDQRTQEDAIARVLAFAGDTTDPSQIAQELWGKSDTFRVGAARGWQESANDIPAEAKRDIDEMLAIIERLTHR